MKIVLCFALAMPLVAQSWYPHHNFHVGAGAGRPGGQLAGPLLDTPSLSVGYGYRLHRYLQADVGLDTLFGAARIRDFLETRFGDLRIRDYQFLIPFGGRAILPLQRGRFLVSAGGGGVHLRYAEVLDQPSEFFRFACRPCGSRNGWGYYGLLGGSMALDRLQRFRVGVSSRFYRGHTEGDPLGSVPGTRTNDRWVNLSGEFLVSF